MLSLYTLLSEADDSTLAATILRLTNDSLSWEWPFSNLSFLLQTHFFFSLFHVKKKTFHLPHLIFPWYLMIDSMHLVFTNNIYINVIYHMISSFTYWPNQNKTCCVCCLYYPCIDSLPTKTLHSFSFLGPNWTREALITNFILLLSFVSIVHLHVNVLSRSAAHVSFCSKSQESYNFYSTKTDNNIFIYICVHT